jgi:hypothetical protein
VWRLAPIYGRSDRDGIRSHFYLWPLYRTTEQDDGDFHFRRRDGVLVLWRHQREWDEDTRRSRSLDTLLGVLRSDARDGRPAGQVPALIDSCCRPTAACSPVGTPLGRTPVGHRSGRRARLERPLGPGHARARAAAIALVRRSVAARKEARGD